MDNDRVIPLSIAEPPDHVVSDLDAAIELVASGGARRVLLAGLVGIEAAAPLVLGHAQAAGVRFALRRSPGMLFPMAVVGPLDS